MSIPLFSKYNANWLLSWFDRNFLKNLDFCQLKLHFWKISGHCAFGPLLLICTIALDDIWDAFLYSDMKGYILPNFFSFCILHIWYNITTLLLSFRLPPKKPFWIHIPLMFTFQNFLSSLWLDYDLARRMSGRNGILVSSPL